MAMIPGTLCIPKRMKDGSRIAQHLCLLLQEDTLAAWVVQIEIALVKCDDFSVIRIQGDQLMDLAMVP